MDIIFYITGILTGMFFLAMLRYKAKYSSVKSENANLKYENEELSNFKKRYGFRKREGIIKTSFKRSKGKNIDFIIEITEIEKTSDKSKIIIDHISCLDADEDFDSRDASRIRKLIGDWVKTSDIEWNIDKSKSEIRNDNIDDILSEIE